jgi:hypothetical protein
MEYALTTIHSLGGSFYVIVGIFAGVPVSMVVLPRMSRAI